MFAFGGRDDKLFRGGIMESGAPTTGPYQSAISAFANTSYEAVVEKAGCSSSADKLACLRSLDYSSAYKAFGPLGNSTLTEFFPVIDGGFIAESPSKQLLSGKYLKIPTLQGHNDDEGSLFTLLTFSNSDAATMSYVESTHIL